MMQIPSLPNPYMQAPMQPMAPSYNAVKIDVHNPQVNAPGTQQMQPQYAATTAPYYNYPEASLYNYPPAQQMPYYMPQMPMPCPTCVGPQAPTPEVMPQAPITPAPTVQPMPAQPQTVNIPAPVIQPQPAPQTETVQKPEIVPPAPLTPQVDLNSIIAKLADPDFEVQANTMEAMANMVKDNPQAATELLDVKVMDTLNSIVNSDSSKLAGPSAEQIAARQKLMSGEQLSDADKQMATTITPMEQAERNKSYAIFTSAILQKLYGDEVAKLTNTTVPLTELPGAVSIVEQLKNNPNPMVRTSAIEAMSYIQQPAYAKDLNTLFTIAKTDQDKGVQEAATAALEKLNAPAVPKQEQPLGTEQKEAVQVEMNPQQPAAQAA